MSMQSELKAEQKRMSAAWQQSQESWESMQQEHAEFRESLRQRKVEAERAGGEVAVEIRRISTQLEAERALLQQERELCREERRGLSKATMEHRQEVRRQCGGGDGGMGRWRREVGEEGKGEMGRHWEVKGWASWGGMRRWKVKG